MPSSMNRVALAAARHYPDGCAMRLWLLAIIFSCGALEAFAHPGSGIVVDRKGIVYFVDTGSGIWRIDRDGTLTRMTGPAYHWMAIDTDGRLQNATLPHFSMGDATVTRSGTNPNLLVASDFPITVGRDGALYYPWLSAGKSLQIFRLAPDGATTVFEALPANSGGGPLRWLNGLAIGPDGSVYYSENRAIRRITAEGRLTTVVENVALTGCDPLPEVEADFRPYFRGIVVDPGGAVYVAATGCRAVIKISPDNNISTVLRTSGPWSPTGVALSGGDLYVLEYLHTEGDNRREWLPRVRKVGTDGSVSTIANIDRR